MNRVTHRSVFRPNVNRSKRGDAYRLAWVRLVADTSIAILYAYLALQSGAWQLIVMSVLMLGLIAIDLTGLLLIWQRRTVLGTWLIIVGLLPVLFINSLLIAGLGLILAVTSLSMTALAATQSLPARQANWAIMSGAMASIAILLVDVVYLPIDRLQVPELVRTLFPLLVGLLILVSAVFMLRSFRDYSLRTKFVITFLAVALIPLGVLAFINSFTTQKRLTEDANQRLASSATQAATSIDTFLRTNMDSVRAEAGLPGFTDLLSVTDRMPAGITQRPVLVNLSNKDPEHIISYGLLNKQGINIADSVKENIGLSEADQSYFRAPLRNGQTYVSPVLFAEDTGEARLYFSSPIHNIVGEFIGVLRVAYRADVLQSLIEDSADVESSFAVLFDENHLHLAHSDVPTAREVNYKLVVLPEDRKHLTELLNAGRLPNQPLENLTTELPDLEDNLANWATQPFFEATDAATGAKLNQVAVTGLETQPWLLAFFQPQDVLFAPVADQARNILFFAVGIGLVAAIVAIEISQRLAHPIARLTSAAQQVAGGNLNVQAPVESRDETGQLSAAFNSMTIQLDQLVGSLEDQVRARTAELALSMEVGQRAAAIRDLANLLPTITEFIREQFDLYYVQVYFVDDVGKKLVIKSGTGEVGTRLMARDHGVPVEAGSIVGKVAVTGRTVIVSDTDTSNIHRPNALLPSTRSELAVPLKIEGSVVGVLDMQAARVNTFTPGNQTVFEAMATQLAISINSAQQWAAAQEAQQKTEGALRQLTQRTWRDTLAARQENLAYGYDLSAIVPLDSNRVTKSSRDQAAGVTVPVLVQNEPIGQLSVEVPPETGWSEDEQAFLEAVAQQIAQKAENLRLFENTQKRARREQIARKITDRIRTSQNIEAALKVAVEELSQALGVARTVADLKASDDADDGQPD